MKVRIGITLDGLPAEYDTALNRPLLLLGDAGRGKTTMTRFVMRWWLADTNRHGLVVTDRPGEWADLHCECAAPAEVDKIAESPFSRCFLTVVDIGIDSPNSSDAMRISAGMSNVVVTSYGETLTGPPVTFEVDPLCIGLARPISSSATALESSVLSGQCRLDWPPETVVVVADDRGPQDFPFHRWRQAPTTAPASDAARAGAIGTAI